MVEERSEEFHIDPRQDILRKARKMGQVPLLPASGARLLEVARQDPDDVNITELSDLISHDPAIASKVLRIANSTYYNLLQKVTTVRAAIITIGLQDIISLVLVSSLMDKFRSAVKMKNLDSKDFWTHCVAVGAATRVGAMYVGTSMLVPAEMSLAGLLHDIGKNVFIRYYPKEYDECIARAAQSGVPLHEMEEETFGINHAELGGMLAEQWKLPDFLQEAIRSHHDLQECDDLYRDVAILTTWANNLIRRNEIGQDGNPYLEEETTTLEGEDGNEHLVRVSEKLHEHEQEILKIVGRDLGTLDEDASSANDDDEAKARSRLSNPRGSSSKAQQEKSLWQKFKNFFGF